MSAANAAPIPEVVLAEWPALVALQVSPAADAGLINHTFLATDASGTPRFVVQRVNPIFTPRVHLDIEAITARLEAEGIPTPRLVRTRAGELCRVAEDGAAWRVLSFVPGLTVHTVDSPGRAASAAGLVARFHRALDGFEWQYQNVREGAHDTPRHLHRLAARAAEGGDDASRALADAIAEQWSSWGGRLDLPDRHCHGDLKISNIRFAKDGAARCLLDLDTLGAYPLDVELGDAWRSWCNPVGEDSVDTRVDLLILEAAIHGYRRERDLTAPEREALVHALERIALELAARFCRDAIEDCYFGWNPARFASRREHNLFRARGQLCLARSARLQRSDIARLLQ